MPSATPANNKRLVERWRRAKRSRINVIMSAPAIAHSPSAHPGSCPCPSKTAAISPTPAPFETPSRPGSASGFSNSACITAPDSASAAPTSNTASVRGRRICQTNSSPGRLTSHRGQSTGSPAHKLRSVASSTSSDRLRSQRTFRRCCWRAKVSMLSIQLKRGSVILRWVSFT